MLVAREVEVRAGARLLLTPVSFQVAPGDKVLLHSPTYIGFTKSLENNGLSIVHSPLKIDEEGV